MMELADLLAVLLEEAWGVHAIGDSAADHGQPMEDEGRLIGVLEHQLIQDIENNRENDDGGGDDADLRCRAQLAEPLGQRPCYLFEEPHRSAQMLGRCTGSKEGWCWCWCRELSDGAMDWQPATSSTVSIKGVEGEGWAGRNNNRKPKGGPPAMGMAIRDGGLLVNV